ncbi:MAG TPA: SRPBCC family protein [Candidatus Acidoferrum sp.]|nr:SRPBCC family protein [Candidatus Acidoferrum sp.]
MLSARRARFRRRFWSVQVDALERHLDRTEQLTFSCNEKEDEEKKMNERAQYAPGPANMAQVQKSDGPKWTLILVRELRHSPEKVWEALTDPAHLRQWAPFDVDASLGTVGTVKLTWIGNPKPIETKVTRVEAPRLLEYGDNRWELEAIDGGTRLTLWSNIDRRFIAWGAAGWQISFDVLDRLLAGQPIGRIAGGDAMGLEGWLRLCAEYAQQFGIENPKWPGKPTPK